MKIALPKTDFTTKGHKQVLIPLVPPPSEDDLNKDNSTSFSLRTDRANADSPSYKIHCRILQGGEDLAVILQWRRSVTRVLKGLGLTTLRPSINIVETMMRGTPLSLFRAAIALEAQYAYDAAIEAVPAGAGHDAAVAAIEAQGVGHYEADAHFTLAMRSVVNQLAPKKSLQRVKRYLRRDCRKPADMKVRTYFQHILKINMEDIPMLPPFSDQSRLSNDELMDIVLFGTPRSWQREMDRQGFDPIDHSLSEVVDFLEQVETSEDFEGSPAKNKGNKSSQQKRAPSGNHQKRGNQDQKYCSFHGMGGHSTDECYKLQGDAKRQKGSKGGSGKYSNKKWSRNDSAQSQKELATFVKKAVAEGIKESANNQKKRKSANDLNAFELDTDLKDFNYADMDNLKIDTDDEVSV